MDHHVSKLERVLGLLALLGLLGINVWYTHHAIDGSIERQCELINAQVRAYDESPPQTETGIALAVAYRTLKTENHC